MQRKPATARLLFLLYALRGTQNFARTTSKGSRYITDGCARDSKTPGSKHVQFLLPAGGPSQHNKLAFRHTSTHSSKKPAFLVVAPRIQRPKGGSKS